MIPRLFENENLVVVAKVPGELSTPGRFADDRPVLGTRLQHELKIQIFPVHRLDLEVGGLIIFAKNRKAHEVSQKWFETKMIQKTYVAWTSLRNFSGWPASAPKEDQAMLLEPEKVLHWKCQILRGKRRSFVSPQGDWSKTDAKFVSENKEQNKIIWNLKPKTGRPHQLRLELARRGFPIWGDQLYGSQVKAKEKDQIFLWAESLSTSEIPEDKRLGLPESLFCPHPFEKWGLDGEA